MTSVVKLFTQPDPGAGEHPSFICTVPTLMKSCSKRCTLTLSVFTEKAAGLIAGNINPDGFVSMRLGSHFHLH